LRLDAAGTWSDYNIPNVIGHISDRPLVRRVVRYLRDRSLDSIVVVAGYVAGRLKTFAAEQVVACVSASVPFGMRTYQRALAPTGHHERDILPAACPTHLAEMGNQPKPSGRIRRSRRSVIATKPESICSAGADGNSTNWWYRWVAAIELRPRFSSE